MTQIENVARAINNATCDDLGCDRDDDWQVYIPEAKAAIAAMTVQAEPVAWMYERDDGSRDLLLDCNGEYARNLLELGATETPLYAHPPVPQWQGIEGRPVAWHSPLGGLIEARQIAQQAYKDIEREKSINGHIAGNPYDVALSALNSVLGCLAVLVDPTPPNGGSDAE